MKKEKIIEKIKAGEMGYYQVSIFKRKDPEIIDAFLSVASDFEVDTFARKNKNNLEVMKLVVARKPRLYKYCTKKLKQDYDLALLAVTKLGPNYALLNETIKEIPEIIEATLNENNDCIALISEDLFEDKAIAKTLLEVNPTFWDHIGAALKEEEEFILEVAEEYPQLISLFDPKWYDNERVFKVACAVDGTALRYATSRIKNNKEIVNIAVENNPLAVAFASLKIRSNKEFMKEIIEIEPLTLEFASADLQDDEEVVLCAIKNNPEAIKFASKRLLHDEAFLNECVELNSAASDAIKEVKAIEARSYKLKSIRSDDVHVRNGVVFGVKLSEDKNEVYNDIMKRSFTTFLDGLTHEELLVLDRLLKAEANIIVEKIKKEGKSELSDRDLRTIATYRKVYLRVKQLKLKEEDYNRSKVDMSKCYTLVDTASKIADRVIRI